MHHTWACMHVANMRLKWVSRIVCGRHFLLLIICSMVGGNCRAICWVMLVAAGWLFALFLVIKTGNGNVYVLSYAIWHVWEHAVTKTDDVCL